MIAFLCLLHIKRIEGFVVDLIQSWKESLRLLEMQNLKSFLLVVVKTFTDVYREINKPLASRGNWVLLVALGLLIGLTNVIKLLHLFWVEAILLNGMLHFLFFFFALAMRPSVALKDWSYFRSYTERFWVLLVLTLILGVSQIYVIPIAGLFIFIMYMFFLLFSFDTHGSMNELIRSMQNSFIMVLYNLPICAVLWGVLAVINFILYELVGFALGYFGGLTIAAILYILVVPIEVAFITNLYIMFVHSQSSLYFPQPKQ